MSLISLTRCQFLMPFADLHAQIGAPTESLLEKFKLPVVLHGKEDSYVPIRNAIQFAETAARTQGITDFGYRVSLGVAFEHLSQGTQALILNAPTLFSALRFACARAHIEDTNLVMHLEFHGDTLRICTRLKGTAGLQHFEHSQWIQNVLPVEIVRKFVGPAWTPRTMAFEAHYTPGMDAREHWGNSRFLSRQKTSWIDVPVKYLGLCSLPVEDADASDGVGDAGSPNGLVRTLTLMLPAYLDGKVPTLMDVAEMANTSRRSLQRMLSDTGLSYREILNAVRFERAVALLRNEEMKITDIALSLGYSDPAHFTRSFQRAAGVSPSRFRVANRGR